MGKPQAYTARRCALAVTVLERAQIEVRNPRERFVSRAIAESKSSRAFIGNGYSIRCLARQREANRGFVVVVTTSLLMSAEIPAPNRESVFRHTIVTRASPASVASSHRSWLHGVDRSQLDGTRAREVQLVRGSIGAPLVTGCELVRHALRSLPQDT